MFLCLGRALSFPAIELRGVVINRTTNHPASGDVVVLLDASESGMREISRTVTDRSGHFRLSVVDGKPHLIRVTHQGVTYHQVRNPGATQLPIDVFDVTDQLASVEAIMDVQRFETYGDSLEVKQLITLRNTSRPPRTVTSQRTLQIQLPPEARVEGGLVQVENAQALKYKPIPGEQKGEYYYQSPIRPGDTRFAVIYRIPYKETAVVEPKILNAGEKFVVMLPKSMKFEPSANGVFQPMPDITADNVLGTAPVKLGQTLSFRISGTGRLAELEGRHQQALEATEKPLPGGGLGPANGSPDALDEYRWQILSAFALLMVAGAMYVVRKTPTTLPRYDGLSTKLSHRTLHRPENSRVRHGRRKVARRAT